MAQLCHPAGEQREVLHLALARLLLDVPGKEQLHSRTYIRLGAIKLLHDRGFMLIKSTKGLPCCLI